MGGYLMSVIGVALCVGLFEELLPSGSGSRTYLRLLGGLCILALMVTPLGRFLGSLPSLLDEISVSEQDIENEYDKILQGTLRDSVREELKLAILSSLEREFSVRRERTEVGILFDEDESLSPSRVVITLHGRDILKDPYKIEDYFEALLGCECMVLTG